MMTPMMLSRELRPPWTLVFTLAAAVDVAAPAAEEVLALVALTAAELAEPAEVAVAGAEVVGVEADPVGVETDAGGAVADAVEVGCVAADDSEEVGWLVAPAVLGERTWSAALD